jgi:single-strand DNA-binding protein
VAQQYLAKGRPVLVEGRLKFEQWTDRETGAKRSKLKVIGETLQLLGGRDAGRDGSSRDAAQAENSSLSPDEAIAAAEETPF